MKKVKSIHFVGIKGVGMTQLAIMAKEAKITVIIVFLFLSS